MTQIDIAALVADLTGPIPVIEGLSGPYPDETAIRDTADQAVAALIAQGAELKRYRAALVEIAELTEREKSCYPPDWHDIINSCPECQRYKDHPIQRGICDEHRRPIYAQEKHDRHETSILGYRAKSIARAALGEKP